MTMGFRMNDFGTIALKFLMICTSVRLALDLFGHTHAKLRFSK